jgi:hypothetical protein
MTRYTDENSQHADRSFLHALLYSTLGTTLISIMAACVGSSLAFAPVISPPERPNADQQLSGQPHFQVSPIPPGAD